MKKYIFCTLGLFSFASAVTASAADSLLGTWELSHIECESSTPVQNPQHVLNAMKGTFTFAEKTYSVTWDYAVKIDAAMLASTMQQLNAEKLTIDRLPDGPEKQAELEQFQASVNLAQRYAQGVHCGLQTGGTYDVAGKSIDLTETSYSQSADLACSGGDASATASSGTVSTADRFSLSGDTLKLYSTAADQSSDVCPLADTVVVLTRKK
jgi:hypothetical protein